MVERRYPNFFYPGEPLAADEIRVTVLGSGTPFARRQQGSAGLLVETGDGEVFLLDFGSGAYSALNSLEIAQSRFDKVFLSHLHVDHWADVPLLYAKSTSLGRHTPLQVWGPSGLDSCGTASWAEGLRVMMAWDLEARRGISVDESRKLVVHEFDYATPQTVYKGNAATITAFPALHWWDGPVSYRVDWKGLSLVYAGDTKPTTFMVEHGSGADVLIHEAREPAAVHAAHSGMPVSAIESVFENAHTSARAAGMIFDLTRPRLAVMFHHRLNSDVIVPLVDEVRQTYDGPVAIAEDFMVLNISPDGVKQRMAVTSSHPHPVTEMLGMKDNGYRPEEMRQPSEWIRDAEVRLPDSPMSPARVESL